MSQSIPQITLYDGIKLPAIGFGTYKLNGSDGVNAITSAISLGYRLIDTAYNYENEGTVGEAIRRSSTPRDNLLITSKLPGRYQEYQKALTAIQESLYRASLDYFDLYLIHWPNPKQDIYVEAWQALIDAKKWGLIRSIGVCNFLPEHMHRLEEETGVKPSINQIELHPFFNQEKQRKWHEENNVQTQSWSPLGRASSVLEQETIKQIAAKHQKTVSQIILRWHFQLGSIAIPKSSSYQRQLENISIFDFSLTDEEMQAIGALSHAAGRLKDQDPAVYEEF
ncbi:2,5-diketo-D-gluconic acid reductase [Virgibacillus pantothenticus]|uniref:2,5-diketo-D-gluconic acid reductase n=1 Tax=Virgibacillus pantothenticus TaxID=1473 RepID=A0A0L0QMU0_VIRPA|nr:MULTISPECIES: aldo/keto reductase [Virgibacillus]API93600.1 2,5-diketo-D-gluconic acid reductase [Virgibacillus sp. 6R]KNE19891.1 2,5-diketo-D-gluconic acid reductase [Virgibacillus pantothenticus]MBS7430008.1 aldo/keto reductase [Virgibacillus sp. 19R1-5]MBU8564894.1 aldo/keto reductase [Virgibacillus pantothenticus]MBU8599202.1 aldo/keto reductase [Virgibacillus pantothenticus]